jgi:chromosome segregation ATPase
MTADYDKALSNLKENLDKAKNLRIRAEARLEQLNRQKQDIVKEIEALGVKPEELDAEIEKLKDEIEALIKRANELLPGDAIKGN